MKQISLEDLPKRSPWPARIMGAEAWEPQERTPDDIRAEYDSEKYARCLGYSNASNCGIVELREFELGDDPERRICASCRDILYEISADDARREMGTLLCQRMKDSIGDAEYVVELGCGYGYNLYVLSENFDGPSFVGGELSKNAVELSERFFTKGIAVLEFDFLDPESYYFLDGLPGPIVVFTCHAIEQLRSSAPVLDALAKRKDTIRDVFHFEPMPRTDHESLLGMLRYRYAELNGYNGQDLARELQRRSSRGEVEIVSEDYDVFGINPLNPTSVVHWRFK